MVNYAATLRPQQTPQTQPVPGKQMVENNAGGYAFQLDDWKRLERFLILGSDGGTYYASEQKLTLDNANVVVRLIKEDGMRVVSTVVEISDSGRAPKNGPAIFALSMCMSPQFATVEVRRAAKESLRKVCRIGTHLYEFVEYCHTLRGGGRLFQNALADWLNPDNPDWLALQAVKYQSRTVGGKTWSLRDVLRLARPSGDRLDPRINAVYKWVTKGELTENAPAIIQGFEKIKAATGKKEAIMAIREYKLPWECVPTEFRTEADVWRAILDNNLPMQALVKNLGNMTKCGLLKPMSNAAKEVVARLGNEDELRMSRLHPLQVLLALKTYGSGQGFRGSNTWDPVNSIVDALDDAFYTCFKNVKPSGKNMMLGLDVSGSMTSNMLAGTNLSAREASAAMAMVTVKTEPNTFCVAFSTRLQDISMEVRKKTNLNDLIRYIDSFNFGETDCALPMLYAAEMKMDVDGFVTYTDNETWAGHIHPFQALEQYRQKSGNNARSVMVGMTATGFSLSDPQTTFMLDVVGFDANAPAVISDFIRG